MTPMLGSAKQLDDTLNLTQPIFDNPYIKSSNNELNGSTIHTNLEKNPGRTNDSVKIFNNQDIQNLGHSYVFKRNEVFD